MLDNLRDYLYQRRKGLVTAAGFAGGLYLAGRYFLERLEEVREQAIQEKAARENLRRRFRQNQQDCTYTVLALVPTLGDRILEEMDVEGVTFTLQMESKAAKSRMDGPTTSYMSASSSSLNTEQPSITSSAELSVPLQGRHHGSSQSPSFHHGEGAQIWVDQFTDQSSSASEIEPSPHDFLHDRGSPTSSSGAHLSDSVTSASVSIVSGSDGVMMESLHSAQSESSESQIASGVGGPAMTTKTKAELWREVKILTFTRTLTILYSTTLLSLLTHIQLNLLGRYKYVQSVLDLEREEKLRERQSFEASVSSLFWGGGDLAGILEGLENDDRRDRLGLFGTGCTGGAERKYLALSWWLVHVGWREIGERVRTAVEGVFDGVSLKAKIGMEDLERLLKDVRQRIEFDDSISVPVGVEGGGPAIPALGRRISFLPSLIPPTPETIKNVLVQGGLPHQLTTIDDPAFLDLVDETRAFVSSADFGRVLETSLDHATDVLFEGLRRTLFTDSLSSVDTPSSEKVRLAGLLPVVARWCHSAIHGTPNELVEGLADVRELADDALTFGYGPTN